MRADLPSGATVDYVPLQDLKGKHKRLLDRTTKMSLPPGVISEDGKVDLDAVLGNVDMFAFGQAKQDALWALLIDKWSYDLPVPELVQGEVENADSFGEIPLDDYEEIERLLTPHAEKLARRPDPKAKAAATTTGSSGSSRANGAHASRTG